MSSWQSALTEEEQKAWSEPVVLFQFSDIGDRFIVEADLVHPHVRYVMDRLRKSKPIHIEGRPASDVRGTDVRWL